MTSSLKGGLLVLQEKTPLSSWLWVDLPLAAGRQETRGDREGNALPKTLRIAEAGDLQTLETQVFSSAAGVSISVPP